MDTGWRLCRKSEENSFKKNRRLGEFFLIKPFHSVFSKAGAAFQRFHTG